MRGFALKRLRLGCSPLAAALQGSFSACALENSQSPPQRRLLSLVPVLQSPLSNISRSFTRIFSLKHWPAKGHWNNRDSSHTTTITNQFHPPIVTTFHRSIPLLKLSYSFSPFIRTIIYSGSIRAEQRKIFRHLQYADLMLQLWLSAKHFGREFVLKVRFQLSFFTENYSKFTKFCQTFHKSTFLIFQLLLF